MAGDDAEGADDTAQRPTGPATMGTLRVTRRKRLITRRAIRHTVLCDGESVAMLRNGETIAVPVPSGGHEVVVQSAGIDLGLRSEPLRVSVAPDGAVDLYVDVTPTSGRPKLTTTRTWS